MADNITIDEIINHLQSRTTPLSTEKCHSLASVLNMWKVKATKQTLVEALITTESEKLTLVG